MTDTTETAVAEVTETTGAEAGTTESKTQASAADTLLTGKEEGGNQEQAPETKDETAEDKPAEGSEEKAEVPEAYEFKFAEGLEVDASTLEDLGGLAKELGLTQEQAQKIADLGAKQSERWQNQLSEIMAENDRQWMEESRADKEFGGDKFDENLALGVKAVETFGGPKLKQLLKESRLGNHPEMLRAWINVGKAIADDSVVPGGRSTNEPKPFYPNSNHT